MFGVSSSFPTGTFGREAVWILTCGVAVLGSVIACRQPNVDQDDHGLAHRVESEPEERTSLLRRVDAEV